MLLPFTKMFLHLTAQFMEFPRNFSKQKAFSSLMLLKRKAEKTTTRNAFLICLQINHLSLLYVCERFSHVCMKRFRSRQIRNENFRVYLFGGEDCCCFSTTLSLLFLRSSLFVYALKDFHFPFSVPTRTTTVF
jgi:hypothetical protein